QGCLVDRFLVNGLALPASPNDALPFVGQGPHRSVMAGSFVALLAIVSSCPTTVQDRFLGVFVKALPEEFRAEVAAVDMTFAPALLGHRGYSAKALQILSAVKSFALRSQGGQQARSQDRSRSRQGFEDSTVGVLLEHLGDLLVELFDGLEQELEFFADQLHAQGIAGEQSDFVAERHGFGDAFQTLLDQALAAGALEVVELLEGFFARFLEALQGGPFEQKGGSQGPPQIFATELQGLREILF